MIVPAISINSGLVFCFPYRGVGGVSLLFKRMSEYLAASEYQDKIHVIDYSDGFIRNNLQSSAVLFIEYRDDARILIGANATVILQSMTPWSIYPGIHLSRDTKLFFWNCHPFNLIPSPPLLKSIIVNHPRTGKLLLRTILWPYYSKMRRFLRHLIDNNAIAFMDGANVEVTKNYLSADIERVEFLPIPGEDKPTLRKDSFGFGQEINAAWVGRITDFKVHILIHTLKSLARYAQLGKTKIVFSIVGSGEYLSLLQRQTWENEYFSLRYIREIKPSELDEFMIKEVDILFAMGTSALEGMKLGVPTVLLDFSYKRIRDGYIFKWATSSKDYSLGDQICAHHYRKGNTSLSDIMSELVCEYPRLSQQMAEFYYNHHSMSFVVKLFLERLSKTSLTYGLLVRSQLTQRDILYRGLVLVRRLKKEFKLMSISRSV